MFKRIVLFLLTNILVLVVIGISTTIISKVFWINIWWYFNWSNYLSLLIYASIVWFSWSIISLFMSKFMAKQAYDIQIVDDNSINNLWDKEIFVYKKVSEISNTLHINMPEVWFYESPEPNAFATWATKNSSLVAVSSGLLETMNYDEIEWVIAHEMAHISNWDMVTMTLLQWVINTFVIFLSRILASIIDNFIKKDESEESSWPSWTYFLVSMVLELVFSILASLVVMKFSRYREYRADEGSANLVWKQKMVLALKKLLSLQDREFLDNSNFASMKISSYKKWWFMSLFSSHPDLQDRINNLETKF